MPLVIQYAEPGANRWVAAPPQLFVRVGTTVQFKVVSPGQIPPPNLNTAAWSNGIHADNVQIAFANASPGASLGQGTVVSVTALAQTVQIRVTAYRLVLGLQPVVATQTSPRTNFGVDERINLSFTTTPVGITAASIGGLRWRLPGVAGRKRKGALQKSGVDKTGPGVDGLAYYIAPYLTDDTSDTIQTVATKQVTLELAVASGPSSGQVESTTITIHRPTVVPTPVAGQAKHTLNQPSAGFVGIITLTPDDVSYSTLEFREASGSLAATGCFKGWAAGWNRDDTHQTESSHTPTIIGGNGLAVSRVNNTNSPGQDDVWTPYNPGAGPTAHVGWDGTYLWKIYWQYRVRKDLRGTESESWVRCQVAEHRSDSNAAGRCVTTKCGGSATFDRTAPQAP